MEVKIDKSFKKDLNKIHDNRLLENVYNTIQDVKKAQNLYQTRNLKKLKNSNNHYRIKIGDYRLGLIATKNTVEFIRCLHRKDIYKFFPK